MARARSFGNIRKLPSSRYQARYWRLGKQVAADTTFASRTDARRWLATVEADMIRGVWVDPDAGRIPFGKYATRWVAERLVFTSLRGGPLLNTNFAPQWSKARDAVGLSHVRFHDLRHLAGTGAGTAGASLREVIAASLRYLKTAEQVHPAECAVVLLGQDPPTQHQVVVALLAVDRSISVMATNAAPSHERA